MIMKGNKNYFSFRNYHSFFRIGAMLLYCSFLAGVMPVMGQDTTAVEETEEVAEEAEEVKSFKSRASLTASQYPDGTIELKTLMRVKVDESYQGIPEAKVSFFLVTPEGEETLLGEATTAANGIATFNTKAEGLAADPEGYFNFISRFDGKNEINGSESDLRIHPARLVIEPMEEDSAYKIKAQAYTDSPEGPQPIVEATVSLYVRRMFSSLKIGEGTTDEEGFTEIDLPGDLPGDENGNLAITAMIEETENYGNLAATLNKSWGSAVTMEMKELPRALWSPTPPTWMVVAFFVLMGTVWVHYAIIIFKLFRIKADKGAQIHEA
jgi:hypothetical protein